MVLRAGASLRALPKQYGSWRTVYRRIREWVRDGILERLWRDYLELLDNDDRLRWSRCFMNRPARRGFWYWQLAGVLRAYQSR